MALRNLLFNFGILPSKTYSISSVGVGNLSMGGTGKSVVVMYLIKLFKKDHPVAVLSRGYGRKTKGLVMGGTNENASTLGDEPYQFLRRYPDTAVVVSEKRTLGMKALEKMTPPRKVILDDVMQHRWVRPKLMIMTTSFERPYFEDFLVPMGGLREFQWGVKRADILLITRSPEDLSELQKEQYLKKIKVNIPVFFTKINYADVWSQNNKRINSTVLEEDFLLVTGIANPNHLVDHLKKNYNAFDHLKFKDHHDYSDSDCQMIQDRAGKRIILTTEKDYVKLVGVLDSKKLYCIPIELEFVSEEERNLFDKMVKAV